MPLQNRVDPFGAIHSVSARGIFTGNRGVIHDPVTKTLGKRRWTTRAWLICRCEFRGRRRAVMGRNAPSGGAGWTELFFLDEVTALAAGHRPCFFCRREEAADFLARFAGASGKGSVRVAVLDAELHHQRFAGGNPPTPIGHDRIEALPDGAVVASGAHAWVKNGGRFLRWSFEGYASPVDADSLPSAFQVVTPPATLAVLSAGYQPCWHPSAGRDRRHDSSDCSTTGTSGRS